MITNFFIPDLNNHDVQELWFQQDGATCHTARATIDLLKDTFGDRLISSFGPVNWPPRSCDLTPLDYFLWGYVKSLIYVDTPQTLDHLEDNIRHVIADIRPQMLEKVIENWTSKLDYIRASRGSHMPEIIFKMRCWDQWIRIREVSFTLTPGSRRPRQTSRREDYRIVRNACVQPTASSAAIQTQVAFSLGDLVSSRIIRRCPVEGHLGARHPLRVLPFTTPLMVGVTGPSPFGDGPHTRELDSRGMEPALL
ncbi:transposable element Tc3 transposase [Trichonephila clavipes]|uniref:Transposable element Tc3 transposase n=1 Tax=Trichonephila clavipes TaxID=2585209 RepID=A0A8X7BCM0_TRICX|nr:transposable element Tc3 transposase [Trichonephila clavipes]